MATLAKLVVKLVSDVSQFTSGLDSASKKLSKVSDSMIGIGNKMTIGLTVPLVAAGTAAVKLASDLEESRNKANVVFGEMAQDVQKFASSAATDMGMTQNEALGFSSTYGAMLKNMGLNADQVAKMSKALTTLTADYGSFHNLSAEEAFEKIKAGMVGSAEPLQALGKDLKASAVQAYALANGIGSTTGELTNSELALARYGLLLSQSKDEMGDFINTSGNLANSTKILGALSKELLTSFGQELVPAVTDLINVLIPMLKKFNEMDPAIKKAIVQTLIYAAAAGPVIRVIGTLGKGITWLTGKFSGTAATTKVAATGFKSLDIAMKNAGLASLRAGGIFAGMKGVLSAVGSALSVVIGPALALGIAIAALIITIKEFGPAAWANFKAIIELETILLKTLVSKIAQGAVNMFKAGRALMGGLIEGVKSVAWHLVDWVLGPIIYTIKAVRDLLKISSPSKVFSDIGKNMMLGLSEGIEKYAPKSIDANLNSLAVVPSTANIKTGRGSITSHNEFIFYGDISESAKKNLKIEFGNLFDTKMKAILE